ncbi:cupin domain-containing protein [Undibacterium sp.]|uniref:cupin domain-containing protein n=1 Tax=Undibacterium sp. TaxID=1914977 RepID=UPI00374CDA35
MQAVNFAKALEQVTEYWTPRIIGRVNDQYLKAAKLKGEFMWHSHADEDELFYVIYGTLTMQLEDRDVHLGPGDFFVVPKNTRHNPVAAEECGLILVESVTTLHTGDLQTDRTVSIEDQLAG